MVTCLNGRFLSVPNLQNMGRLIGMFGIFSIGVGLVIITGGIDLSIGSMIALLGVELAILLGTDHWPWPLALLTVLATGLVLGAIHGLLDYPPPPAAIYRDPLRPVILPGHRAIYL